MTFIFIILAIGAYIYFLGNSEPAELKQLIQGRPQQQQDVIKYFYGKADFPKAGFLCKRITDAEYDNIVSSATKQSNFKQKALDKIGLDETQVNEIEPVNFEGWASVSYTHLRAHETVLDLVCRLLLENKNNKKKKSE